MNRPSLVLVLLLALIAGAIAVWQFRSANEPPPAPSASASAGATTPATAERGGPGNPGPAEAAALVPGATEATGERVAVPATVDLDAGKPGIVGRVVNKEGRPLAGATVAAAPGMAFANAGGDFDLDTFDFTDFGELEATDPATIMNGTRQQLAERVETKTDDEGRFRLVPRGSSAGVGIRVLSRGYAILDRRVARPSARDFDIGDLTLQQGAIVAGRVLLPNGDPVAGARVSRVNQAEDRMLGVIDFELPEMGNIENLRGGEVGTTDAGGRFELAHLPAGTFALRARHVDHPTARGEALTVAPGQQLGDVLLTMQRGGVIRGVVTGLTDGAKGLQVAAAKKPRADADPTGMMGMFGGDFTEMLGEVGMSVGERTTEIEPDGTFVLRGLARETYRIWVARSDASFAGNNVCSARVEAVPGAADVTLAYAPGITVTFKVVDKKTGAPVERLWVADRLRGGGGMADMMAMVPRATRVGHYPEGLVTVASLRPKAKQKLTLTVQATGYRQFERAGIELPEAGLDLGTFELEPTPVFAVTVVAARDGQPVDGATARLVDASERGSRSAMLRMAQMGGGNTSGPRQGKTDRAGKCLLNPFQDRMAHLEVEAKGFAPWVSEPIFFSAEGPSALVAQLHVGGVVEVTVVDEKEAPVPGVMVEQQAPSGDEAQRKTDAAGSVRFERLAPGTQKFRLAKADGQLGAIFSRIEESQNGQKPGRPWSEVTVTDEGTATLRLVKQPTASLRGVVLENGQPLAGARVTFREGSGGDSAAELGENAFGEMMESFGTGVTGGKRNGKSDERGAYQLAELPEGAHRLRITHKGRAMPVTVAVTLVNGDNVFDVELDMTTIRGVVRDQNGAPVDGARLRVRRAKANDGAEAEIGDAMESMMPGLQGGGGSSIKTDAQGVFELRGVDPGVDLVVQASAKGFAPASVKVTCARGTAEQVELRLGASGKVKVTATADGPFVAVRARYVGEGGPVAPVTQLLRRGKGTLDNLRPGLWEIELMVDDKAAENQKRKATVEVIAGQTVDVSL